ncbi:MAG: hypothetical protein AB7U29_15245 [Desulfobulbus sp.]
MRPSLLIVLGLAVATMASAKPAIATDPRTHPDLCGFLAGTYIVVGKKVDSGQTYFGRVILRQNKEGLQVERIIGGKRLRGEGRIEHALGSDAADVLRVRFVHQGEKYEITYLWRSDLDNYARLSGYVYKPGIQTDTPGLEVLFIDPQML